MRNITKYGSNLEFKWIFRKIDFLKKMGKKIFFFEIFSKNSEKKIFKNPKLKYFYILLKYLPYQLNI